MSRLHVRIVDFLQAVVRREAAGRQAQLEREDLLVHPERWLRSDLVPPSPGSLSVVGMCRQQQLCI